MRHPDAARIRDECRTALPAVLEAAGLPATQHFELDREGWVNVCFLGGQIVVRFNARDPELPKFQREQWAYRVLRDRGFPVPRLVAHIDDPEITPYPALVAERIPGENLEATWPTLDTEQQRNLAGQAGRWLARLHTQPFSGFGEVFGDRHATQREWWSRWAGRMVRACEPLWDAKTSARFREAIDQALPLLDSVTESRFVHRDYHLGNILHDGRDVVGLLDFEWAMASDPAIDRSKFGQLDDATPGALRPFRRGYEDEGGPVDDDPRVLGLYRMCHNLELCDVAARFLSAEEAAQYRATTLQSLAGVSR